MAPALSWAWVALALGVVAAAPVGALLVAPLVWGVPHVAADVRFLLLRPAWPGAAASRAWLWFAVVGLLGCRVAALGGVGPPAVVELAVGLIAALGALRAAGGAGALLVAWAGCMAAAAAAPALTALLVGHLHNVVALLLWGLLGAPAARGVAVAAAVAVAVILAGALDGAPLGAVGGLTMESLRATLAPGVAEPWGTRVVLTFALLQLLHYAAWLVWIPGEREGTWRDDLGAVGLALTGVGAAGVALGGWFEPAGVRAGYLSLVLFHGWIELVALAGMAGGRFAAR